MPELPEVETVRRTLLNLVKGCKIVDVTFDYEPMIKTDSKSFMNKIKNQTINDIERYGKYLVFILDQDAMIMHLRMEGKFYVKTAKQLYLPYEHVIFTLDDERQLRYHDTRKFGTIHLLPKDKYKDVYPLSDLGVEPWDIDPTDFYKNVHKRQTAIKNVLLDQHVISGLGNIYVDETLFLSGVKPTRKACKVTKKEAIKLIESARLVLEKAIFLGGTTIRSYTSSLGVHGRFQNELNVHTREGKPCPVCGHIIKKIKVGGRGTYVCPICQK